MTKFIEFTIGRVIYVWISKHWQDIKQFWYDYGTYIILGIITLIVLAIVRSVTEYKNKIKLEVQEQEDGIRPKHSGIGIASFITSVVTGLLLLILLAIAGALIASMPDGVDEESPVAIAIGLFFIFLIITEIVAFGLGIGGICQRDRKKIFAILGTFAKQRGHPFKGCMSSPKAPPCVKRNFSRLF